MSIASPSLALPLGDRVIIVTSQKGESFVVESARSLGDRRLAEETLERDLLSCKFIRIYSLKTSFAMTRMIDIPFNDPQF
jgi:hypothetical protein